MYSSSQQVGESRFCSRSDGRMQWVTLLRESPVAKGTSPAATLSIPSSLTAAAITPSLVYMEKHRENKTGQMINTVEHKHHLQHRCCVYTHPEESSRLLLWPWSLYTDHITITDETWSKAIFISFLNNVTKSILPLKTDLILCKQQWTVQRGSHLPHSQQTGAGDWQAAS